MFYWSRFPIVRITLFFIAGVLLGIYLPGLSLVLGYTLIIFTVSYIFLIIRRKNLLLKYNFLYGLSISVIFTCLGFFSLTNANETVSGNHLIHQNGSAYYSCIISSEPQVVGNYLRMTVKVESMRNEVWQQARGKILLYLVPSQNLTLQYGDRLIIKGFPARVPPPLNPKEFDYQQYLSFNNIFHQHFVNRDAWELIAPAAGFSLERQAILARNYLEERLSLFVHGEEELSIAKALILGKKEDLSKSTKEIFAQAGAMHVLAVSGLHVGVIYLVLLWLIGQRNSVKARPVLVASIVIPALWAYAFITGLSPSVLRAVTMFTFLAIAQMTNRRSNTFNTLAISALILLLLDPYLIMSVGFQLSYIAVAGIIFLYPVFEKMLNPSNSILRFFWQITALSLAAQLVTSPLSALYFHRFPSFFLISNLLVIPAAMLIVWSGMGLLILSSIYDTFGVIIGKVLSTVIWLLNHALSWLSTLPYADIKNLAPSIIDTWLLYGILVFVFMFYFLRKRSYAWLSGTFVLVYCLNSFYSNIEGKQLQQIVFYSVNNSWAIDLVENEQYIALGDSLLFRDRNKLDYLLTPYRRHYGLSPNSNVIESVTSTIFGDVLVWHGRSILLADSCLRKDKIPAYFDYVLFKVAKSKNECYQVRNLLLKLVKNKVRSYEEYDLHAKGALIINI